MMRFSLVDFGRDLPCVLILFSLLAAITTWDRDALMLVALCLVSLIVVAILKRTLKHSRPRNSTYCREGACGQLGVGIENRDDRFGMPSGHATVSFAFFAFAGYVLVRHLRDNKQELNGWQVALSWGVTVPLFVLTPMAIAYQRVFTRCHSVPQVLAGAVLGLVLGGAAVWLTMLDDERKGLSGAARDARFLERLMAAGEGHA